MTSVVIADDDADIRVLVEIAVRKAGLELVASAADGDAAYLAIRERQPDLAVLDVSMPGMTGIEVCRLVRADAAFGATTIVLLTAAVDEQSRATAADAGASELLGKPFSPRELATRLTEIAAALR
jgi:DNA-binding response OmpR family regulator